RRRGAQERVDVRVELPSLVDDLVLLLDADREKALPAHAASSTTNVGTTLPAPAVTLSRAAAETRVMKPPARPSNRYGSRSTARLTFLCRSWARKLLTTHAVPAT